MAWYDPVNLAMLSLGVAAWGGTSISVFILIGAPMESTWMWAAASMALLHACLVHVCLDVEERVLGK